MRTKDTVPGFYHTLGITVTFLSLFILIPLASVLVYSFHMPFNEFCKLLLADNVKNAFLTSIKCALAAAVVNSFFGTIIAWTLVRYDFRGKRLMDALIELPFALPTAVAGITLSKLY